jgi:hypothetical protein
LVYKSRALADESDGLTHVPAKWIPVRQGEPLFADKDMRQLWKLRRFPFIWDHRSDPI